MTIILRVRMLLLEILKHLTTLKILKHLATPKTLKTLKILKKLDPFQSHLCGADLDYGASITFMMKSKTKQQPN